MRHQKAGTKLNRTGSHRNAMFRNMVTSLFQHGQIRTTDAKAKELKRWADWMVTLAKRGDLHARRQVLAVMRDKPTVHKLFEDATSRFGDRAGGYTNVIKIGRRRGDAAPMSLVELVKPIEKKEKKKKKPKAKKKVADKAVKAAAVTAPKKEQPEDVKAENQKVEQEAADKELEQAEEAQEVKEAVADTEQEEAAAPEIDEEAKDVEASSEESEVSNSEEDQEKT